MNREMQKTTLFLSHDLSIQILLRLPLKSLVRFKCVCKLWLSLISDPHFAKLHFELDCTRTQRLVLFRPYANEIRSIDFNAPSLQDESSSAQIKLNFPIPALSEDVKIIGSCRGFLLFDYCSCFYMWNPISGVHKRIPWPYCFSDRNNPSCPFLKGFGYDPSTDDYLVPLVSYDVAERAVNRVEFFSLRANTWKEIEGPPFPYTIFNEYFVPVLGLLFKGAIHWIANHRERREGVIVVFDLTERTFSEMALPGDVNCFLEFCDLRVFGGRLSLCAPGYTSKRGGVVGGVWVMEEFTEEGGIWVMEEYKVQSSWTKCDIVVSPDNTSRFLSPICCTKSGDIVGTDGQRLVKFNDKGEKLEYCTYCDHSNGWDVVMYRESLLSLPGDN